MLVTLAALIIHLAAAAPDPPAVRVVLPSSNADITVSASADEAVGSAARELEAGQFDKAGRAFRALADAGGGASLRYYEAVAWYEAGQLHRASTAIQQALTGDPDSGPALSLSGLILADLGQGDRALQVLERASERANQLGDAQLLARVRVNQGLIALDRGEPRRAVDRFGAARTSAQSAGDAALVEIAAENLATAESRLAGGSGGDMLSRVADRLRAGDVDAARSAIVRPSEGDRRGAARALLADAAVDRAEGRLDDANVKTRRALHLAREGGLVRETAAALAQIGGLYLLAGRFSLALDTLQEAVGTVAGTSLRVQELSYRIEAGRVAIRLGQSEQARDQLDVALVVAEQVHDPIASVRIGELRGHLAEADGETDQASEGLAAAYEGYRKRGYHADAARVASDLVAHHAGRSEDQRTAWERRAIEAFASTGDAAGPAHVRVAAGLGYARRHELAAALKAFAEAARLAEALQTGRGAQIASHARANAAEALKALGHDEEQVARLAADSDLGAALRAHERFGEAEQHYRDGLVEFEGGDYRKARYAFQRAMDAFTRIEEAGLVARARRGRGWSARNEAIRLPPAEAHPLFDLARGDGAAVDDLQLQAKAAVGGALASAELDRREANEKLLDASELAESVGLTDEAIQCLAELSERLDSLDARHEVVRRVLALRPDAPEAVHAAYSLAVDAYNLDDYALALELSTEILPHAGGLRDPIEAVRAAAEEQLSSTSEP